jgi:small subunit ribosomal protein S33
MVKYYPEEVNFAQIIRKYPELELVDSVEQQRLADVEDRKRRGKGAPKKAKTKGAFLLHFMSMHGWLTFFPFLS